MRMDIILIITAIATILPIVMVGSFWLGREILREYMVMNKNKSYLEVCNYFCERSYEAVHKDQILPYITSGFRLTGAQLETTKRNFVKLNYELMGPRIVTCLSVFYGDDETLTKNLITWFTTRIDVEELTEHVKQVTSPQPVEDKSYEPPSEDSSEEEQGQ